MDEKIPYTPENTQPTPAYEPTTPAYEPTAPAYEPTAPAYEPTAPAYEPTAPAYEPAAPAYEPTAPAYQPVANNQAPYYPQPPYNGAPVYSPAPQPVKPEKKHCKILGLISFILGFSVIGITLILFVLALILESGDFIVFTFITTWVFIAFTIAGIMFGVLGIKACSIRGKSIIGLICNNVALILSIVLVFVYLFMGLMYGPKSSWEDIYDDYNNYNDDYVVYYDYDYDDYYDYDYDDYDYDYDYDYDDYYDYDYSYDSYDSYDYDSDYNFCAASGCLNRAYAGDYCLDHNYLE